MHQVVFPLVPGSLKVSQASLRYSVPVAMQFFSQEEQFTLESNPVTLTVVPLPAAGKPAGFAGAVGRGVSIARTIRPASGKTGEALNVDIAVSGARQRGALARPELIWPGGVRAYVDKVDDQLATSAGLLGGTKTFHHLAVPDSAGVIVLGGLRYPYFDLDTRSYRVATAPAAAVTVAAASEAATARALPPALLPVTGIPLAARIAGLLPAWLWASLALLAPLVAQSPRCAGAGRGRRQWSATDVAGADRRLQAALQALVPDVDRYSGRELSCRRSVRQASRPHSRSASRPLRERSWRAATARRRDGASVVAAAARELDLVTAQLGGRLAAGGRAEPPAVAVICCWRRCRVPRPDQSRNSSTSRARCTPLPTDSPGAPGRADVPAHWYTLGAADYRLGLEGRDGRMAPRGAARASPQRSTPRAPHGGPAR